MAQLRYVVLSIASAFLLLQLSEQVAASFGAVSAYPPPYASSACFGPDPDQFPEDQFFAAAGINDLSNLWDDGKNCGKFFKIQCRKHCKTDKSMRVKIVDCCRRDCLAGRAFDLSFPAFAAIADEGVGFIVVEYSLDEEDAETFIAEVGHIGQ